MSRQQRLFRRLHGFSGGSDPLGVINPLNLLHLEQYFDSTMGLSGVADGGNVNPWPDQSGNGRHMINQVFGTVPVLHRTGTKISANGSPTVEFNGVNTSMRAVITPDPGQSRGMTFIHYGRFRDSTAGF